MKQQLLEKTPDGTQPEAAGGKTSTAAVVIPTPETTMHSGGTISRSNRLFVQISRIGEIDAKGKVIFAMGFKGKRIAHPDRPLAMMAGFINSCIVDTFHYSSAAECAKDIELFKEYANALCVQKPEDSATSASEVLRSSSFSQEKSPRETR